MEKTGYEEAREQFIHAARKLIKEIIHAVKEVWGNLKDFIIKKNIEFIERPIIEPRFTHPAVKDMRRNSQVMSRKPLVVRRMNM